MIDRGVVVTRRRLSTPISLAELTSKHATALLGDYRGILQCDGYGAYKQLVGPVGDPASVTLAFCWSHVRRAFYDLAKAGAPIATETPVTYRRAV
jgi:hypothetical protein